MIPPANSPEDAVVDRFQPRLTLRTLTRGDGLLGLRPNGPFGPRGGSVTVARAEWLYSGADDLQWRTAAPTQVLGPRPAPSARVTDDRGRAMLLLRDLSAEAQALDELRDTGLLPVPLGSLQWRARELSAGDGEFWSLPQEEFFGDFWADQVPALRERGWSVVVLPGFAHESVAIDTWSLVLSPDSGEPLGKEVAGPIVKRTQRLSALRSPPREGSWLLTLGVEIDGQRLDLAPLIAQLLKRDSRWIDAAELAGIADDELIALRAPGGRRVISPAAPLKAIVGAMLDLLTDPLRREGPLLLSAWEAPRLEALRQSLLDTQAERAGPRGAWQLQGEAGLQALAQRLRGHGEPRPVEAPTGLGIELRPYQLQGVAWLQYLREHDLAGILADDMGLGKTAQALAHLLIERQAGRLDRPALIVLPTTLIFNWQAEARRIAPALRLLTLHGPARADDFARIAEHDVVLTTFPLVWRDLDALRAHEFHLLILDEAQLVKNAAGRAAAAVRRLRARHRLCLTGTPLENHLGDLWSQFDFLMPGFLGDARSFHRQWRKPIEESGETLRARLLAQRVRPFVLRRRKADVASELPPKTEATRRVRLQGAQRDLYESVRVAADKQVRRALAKSTFRGAQISVLDALLKLRQVCCDPRLVRGNTVPATMPCAKLELLREMLPALVEEGRRVLVFSQFTAMLDLIDAELEALRLPRLALSGRTPQRERGEVVRRFQAKTVPILLVSLKAGGVGLNLSAADTVIHVDPWWNPAVEQQATDRAHRIGQDQPVLVYKLVVEGSIEERILALQERKSVLAEGVLGHDGAVAMKFSAEDLEGLLAPIDVID